MKVIFEAHVGMTVRDFDSETEARIWVENNGHGYVVKFVRGFDGRDRSCAMTTFKNDEWQGVDISR